MLTPIMKLQKFRAGIESFFVPEMTGRCQGFERRGCTGAVEAGGATSGGGEKSRHERYKMLIHNMLT
jgi:hypothetical protein